MERKLFSRLLTCGVLVLALSLLLSSCGGGGGGGPQSNTPSSGAVLSGKASDGPIADGTVDVYALNADGSTGALIATATTDSNGNYSVNLGSYSGNVIVEVAGGTYTDEATGQTFNNTLMRAVVSGATGNISVAVTPLTEIATE
ncbi:MAG: hypothetical protein M0Z75_03225, partial [Nitrospiraceae bacterium]|nr:hypothetical protein [Nitrospiraceae bacterium]